jgi:hypothetical protein
MPWSKQVKIVFDGRGYWLLWHWETFLTAGASTASVYASGPFESIAVAEKAVTPGWNLIPYQS